MARITDGLNVNQPWLVSDYGWADISVTDFDPITDYHDWRFPADNMHESRRGNYIKKGFLARPDADGGFYAITHQQFMDAIKHPEGQDEVTILAGLVPQLFHGMEGQWVECRLVKVFAADSSEDLDMASGVNIGFIL
jgi:hypothetical protein